MAVKNTIITSRISATALIHAEKAEIHPPLLLSCQCKYQSSAKGK